MARMLYWGAQGITRDVSAALDYYRLAAESGDAQALFDYGIVLLKVLLLVWANEQIDERIEFLITLSVGQLATTMFVCVSCYAEFCPIYFRFAS